MDETLVLTVGLWWHKTLRHGELAADCAVRAIRGLGLRVLWKVFRRKVAGLIRAARFVFFSSLLRLTHRSSQSFVIQFVIFDLYYKTTRYTAIEAGDSIRRHSCYIRFNLLVKPLLC